MLAGLTGFHLIAIAAVLLVLFGATKLPVFAKGLGSSIKILRGELQQPEAEPVPVRVAADAGPTAAGPTTDAPRQVH